MWIDHYEARQRPDMQPSQDLHVAGQRGIAFRAVAE